MIAIILFICAVVITTYQVYRQRKPFIESFLGNLIFFNIGIMGLFGFYGHIFMANEIAIQIGWEKGSPFQFEIGMANLAFGVLGLLSLWVRGSFWTATVLGISILLIGCFIGHIIQYQQGDHAPYNIGIFIWFNDLFIPFLALILLWNYTGSKEKGYP